MVCDQTVWQQQIDSLSDIAECACPDYGSLDSLPAMAASVLERAPEQFSIAGHSMGGRVALEVYRLAPQRVNRMAVFNTGYLPLAQGAAGQEEKRKRNELVALAQSAGMRAMLAKWLPPMLHPSRLNKASLVNTIMDMMSRKAPEIFAAQIHALIARPDAGPVLAQIRCPALVLTGREDNWSPPAQHAAIAERIAGSELVIVPTCGHMSTMEQPVEVSAALRNWLARPAPL